MIIEYHRTHFNSHPPTRGNPSDAGLDVYFSPKTRDPVTIEPGQSVILPTGLKFGVPHGYMLEVKNKSGIASKRQLLVGACVIDPGYDGEIFVNLHNVGESAQVIMPGEKVAQLVLTPVIHCGIEEVHEDNLNLYSRRGKGGFGSTGDR